MRATTTIRGGRPAPTARVCFPKSRRRGPVAATAGRSSGASADERIPGATATVARDLLFGGGTQRAATAAATAPTPSVAPAPPTPRPAVGSWLGPALVGLAVGVAGSWAASAFAKAAAAAATAAAPTGAAAPTAAAAAPPTAAAPAPAPAPAPRKTSRPPRPAGVADAMRWYRTRLPRLHYLQAGGAPLPKIAASELGVDVAEALLAGNRGGEVLIAFQDAADAEFALACMAKGKSTAGAALASASPAQLEGRLGPEQTLFVLPPGRLPIKSVSESGLKQLLLIALLQDVADRAGGVGPSTTTTTVVDEAPVAASGATTAPSSKKDDSPSSSSLQQQQPPRPPPPPAVASAAAAAPTVSAVDAPVVPRPMTPARPIARPIATPATPPSPTPASATANNSNEADDDDDDDEQPFAPVAFSHVEVDERQQQSLLDDYYALEQSWAADRLANVASAAQAQIESIESVVVGGEEAESIESIDRSVGGEGDQVDRSADVDEQDGADDDSKSTVVNKGTRTKREGEEAPPTLAPEELQKSVLAALKEIDPARDDRDKTIRSDAPARPLIGTAGDDFDDGGSTWWKRRLRVVYLPVVNEAEGNGFLQVDISADGCAKDIRVVAFEDQYDAMLCGATMQQLGSFGGSTTCSVAAMSTNKVEGELAEAWRRQQAEGGTASAPSNLLVFRRKKLPLKVGMSEEEFLRCIVYGGAAQTSLLQTGFKF